MTIAKEMSVQRYEEYRFETVWTIDAPITAVWDVIVASERWPEWWPHLVSVEEITPGDSAGIGAIRRYTWRGPLCYRLTFEIIVARVNPPRFIEGVANGDLVGTGCWTLLEQGGNTTRVQYDWHVKTTRQWMNLLGPLMRGLFVWNHDQVMKAGGKGLAAYLGRRRGDLPETAGS